MGTEILLPLSLWGGPRPSHSRLNSLSPWYQHQCSPFSTCCAMGMFRKQCPKDQVLGGEWESLTLPPESLPKPPWG